ncbi:gas vesicle protein [Streptomyces prasinopilosus]|uniref:Gas vesicle protein n=1 Tax=Streptomyces prasinopilosus TaxID=67344 RepID=A0A1G6NGH4_9ACTN|nr:gas vesicle protein [Streptomyces prasinopilosus]SDC66980.1 Gas vesicle protein [Streptomyces prasinopilosus]
MSSYPERIPPSDSGFPSTVSRPVPPQGGTAGAGMSPMQPRRDGDGSLAHVVETLLDKGLVLNADIMVSVAGVELLGIRLRAALASFETAARYGLEFPSGTDTETAAWRDTREEKESCPACGKRSPVEQLLEKWCPWCGWLSAQARMRGPSEDAQPAALTGGREEPTADDAGESDGDEEQDRRAAEPSPAEGEAERRDG